MDNWNGSIQTPFATMIHWDFFFFSGQINTFFSCLVMYPLGTNDSDELTYFLCFPEAPARWGISFVPLHLESVLAGETAWAKGRNPPSALFSSPAMFARTRDTKCKGTGMEKLAGKYDNRKGLLCLRTVWGMLEGLWLPQISLLLDPGQVVFLDLIFAENRKTRQRKVTNIESSPRQKFQGISCFLCEKIISIL